MTYFVKSVFATLQGEGIHTGRRACFVRFAGCNMWNGTPGDDRNKGKGACAKWCDTEFRGGEKMTADELETAMDMAYPQVNPRLKRFCVLTGGEPMLQLDIDLLNVLHQNGWEVAVETNGTVDPMESNLRVLEFVDHIAVSPKLLADGSVPTLVVCKPEHEQTMELKVVLPGHIDATRGWKHDDLRRLANHGCWDALFVQPMDPIDPNFVEVSTLKTGADDNGIHAGCVALCLDFVAKNPDWRLGLQTHKFVGLQ